MKTKQARRPVEILKAESAEYDARFVLSASSPDRVNDTIDPAAYEPYNGGRVIALWQHNDNTPVGVWENLKAGARTLTGDLKLSNTYFARMIRDLLAADVPLGASVRFRGMGEPNTLGGIAFKSIDLVECSIVSIPAHPRAIQIAKKYGHVLTSTEGTPLAMSGDYMERRQRAVYSILKAKRLLKGVRK